jgi:polyphosphate kinase 2 (PPK2 family)
MTSDARAKDLDSRVLGELVDSFDAELEMEIDDDRLKLAIEEFAQKPETASIDRALYFRVQGELVKLQDWVVEQKQKLVVIFEARCGGRRARAVSSSA